MNNNNFFTKSQVKGIMPHMRNFFNDQLQIAKKEILESEEYFKLREEYLTTKEYEDYLNNIDENASEKIAKYVTFMIDNVYNKDEYSSLDKFIYTIVTNMWTLSTKLGTLQINTYNNFSTFREETQGCTKKNYIEIIESNVDKAIDSSIEKAQSYYANHKLIRRNYASRKDDNKLKALISTTSVCSNNELEQIVMNNIDFQELVKTEISYN